MKKKLTGAILLNKGASIALLRGSQSRVKEGIQRKGSKMPTILQKSDVYTPMTNRMIKLKLEKSSKEIRR